MALTCRRQILTDVSSLFALARITGASSSISTETAIMTFCRSNESSSPAGVLGRCMASVPNRQQQAGPRGSSESKSETIEEVRARIFGHHIGDGLRSGRKILAKPLVGDKVVSYYPDNWFAGDPLLVDVGAERAKHKLDRLKRRGKAPPKKGAGKRAGKK